MSAPRPAVTLRQAAAGDLPAIEALVAAAGLPLDGLAACVAGGTAIAAVLDGSLIGVAATERYGRSALLRSVAVAPDQRGRDLGREIVDRALADARAAGAREAWLLTEGAATWFAGLGWSRADRATAPPRVKTSVEFAAACPASAIAFRRVL